MIYQPRNVQPSSTSIDGSVDNIFSMEIQTNSYVSAYQLLIVDFNNNAIYTGSKTTLSNYLYNGDTLEIPVSASSVALSNGTNYKWRVRLYQPNSDMLITYGLVQSTSTTTNIYLQPNINIKAGMTLTINSQSKTISSYNSDTGLAVVSSAFSSVPAVGTQYYIYSDFIETVPDYIVYARRTPGVSISNVPTSLTLKYHTFQGVYNQSDNVPIVYHKFDLYLQNDDGSRTLIDTSDKVYSANLSYTYDAFRTGSTYLIQMTVENDMGVIATTDLYSFNVSYDIVEYLQQPVATFYNKENAVNIAWVTPVEHDATSFRSDAATGTLQDNSDTFTQATFEPGQSIGEGDVVQVTNSDFDMVLYGKSEQETRSGKNLLPVSTASTTTANGITFTNNNDGTYTLSGTATDLFAFDILKNITLSAGTYTLSGCPSGGSSTTYDLRLGTSSSNYDYGNGKTLTLSSKTTYDAVRIVIRAGVTINVIFKPMLEKGSVATDYEQYGASPSPDYPSEIISMSSVENLFYNVVTNSTPSGITLTQNDDGSFILNGTTTGVSKFDFKLPKTLPAGTYTFSIEGSANIPNNVFLRARDNTGQMVSTDSQVRGNNTTKNLYTFTCTKEISIVALNITTSGITFNNFVIKPMLEKGTIAHPYVPYGNYLRIDNVSENLFKPIISQTLNGISIVYNEDGSYTLNGTSTAWTEFRMALNKELEAGDYTLICRYNEINSNIYEVVRTTSLVSVINVNASESDLINVKQITTTNDKKIGVVGITINNGVTLNNFVIKPMLVKGKYTKTNAPTFEPCINKVIYVNMQDKKLCSDKDETIRDEYNITTGKGIKKIGEVILDGSEGWVDSGSKGYLLPVAANVFPNRKISIYDGFVSHFKVEKSPNAWTNLYDCGWNNTGVFWVREDHTIATTLDEWKTWLSNNPVTVQYILETPEEFTTQSVDTSSLKVDGKNYLTFSTNIDSTFDLVYPYKTITGNTNDYTLFNPAGVSNTGTIKSYNALTGVATLMADRPFTYIPMKGDSYAVISNIYNVSGFSYLYNTPYNTVNSLYTHGYTATWSTPDGLCVLPDDFNITLQFSPDSNFYYDKDGVYQEIVNLITTETDGENGEGQFDISVDKNKLVFTRKPDISLEVPFYTGISQVFVLSSNNVAQINNDYIWDDTATWTDTYTWVEGGTSLERICNHWWKVQITNTTIKVEEIYPTT